MIQATSLRLGNYVYYNDNELVNILMIDKSLLRVAIGIDPEHGDFLCSYDKITGIPLTEELLLKMGFEDFDVIYSKSPDLVISKDLEWVGIYNIHLEYDIHYDCPKYIHQLQNLYHALTGQELTLP